VNIGNPNEITIVDFAKLVIDVAGSQSTLTFIIPDDERTRDDPKRRCPDITRAREHLGWAPAVDLRDGLESTVAYFRKRLGLV
jgi:dTDP-glucose 4,6-dehydratase